MENQNACEFSMNSVTRAAHGAVFRFGGILRLIKTILNKQGKPISLGLNLDQYLPVMICKSEVVK